MGATINARVSGVDLRSISAEQSAEKQMIMNEFMHGFGYNRQYAIGLLNRPLPRPRCGSGPVESGSRRRP